MATDHSNSTSKNLDASSQNGSEHSSSTFEKLFGAEFIQLESDLRDLLMQDSGGSLDEPKLGKYQLREILAQSSQSIVFKALDPDLQRHVVIKVYFEPLPVDERNRLIQEGRALAQLNSPYVVRCFGVEEFGDLPCLVLEYVQGRTLDEYFRSQGSLTKREMARVTGEIARAVAVVHQHGLVHGDLKPENVMIQHGGEIKLIDFGLCHTTSKLEAQTPTGTPGFMPPERANNEIEDFGHRSDLFGVCAILYFMLTGEAPFAADTKQEAFEKSQRGQVDPISDAISQSPLGKICLRGLARNPNERFLDAASIANLTDRFRSRLPRRLFFAAGLMALMAGAFFWLKQPSEKPVITRKIPFLSDSELANLKTEIPLQLMFLHRVGDKLEWVQPRHDGFIPLEKNGQYFILVDPNESCFVRIFSFEHEQEWMIDPIFPSWEAGDSTAEMQPLNVDVTKLQIADAYVDADRTELRKNFIDIVPDTVSERDEYVYVFASKDSRESAIFSESKIPVLMRGISRRRDGGRVTQLIKTYRVE